MAFKSTADFVNEYPCPCGDGIYRTEEWTDEWGGSREAWTMVCTKCRPNHVVFEYAYADKGRQWTARNWITKGQERALKHLQHEIKTAASDTLALAHGEYMDAWMELCRGAAKKKQLWKLLNDPADSGCPSLSTFYKHVQRVGLETYWRQQFSIRHARSVMTVLGVEDSELDTRLARLDAMQAEAVALQESYGRSRFA